MQFLMFEFENEFQIRAPIFTLTEYFRDANHFVWQIDYEYSTNIDNPEKTVSLMTSAVAQ